ncbi:MAG TPA: ComF family protein [Candidatus Saccharimonadales bacterium]|nr:ComF family protein [Candidatus Saccharimonadales bacterium]
MSLIDHLLTVLAPYECLGCGAEGPLLCADCLRALPPLPERCYRCRAPSPSAPTCAACATDSLLDKVIIGTAYAGIAKELIARLKFTGARAAARSMALRLAPLLVPSADHGALLVSVPTAASRVRRRGYDQAALLARELSRRTRLPYLACLARSGHTRQLGASREQRLSQLAGAFRVTRPASVKGAHVVLIDDVLTTGATLEAAASVLRAHGAGRISAAVFAQA